MNKPNDICMIFGNPAKCMYPIDQARLIEKISDKRLGMEQWLIEYLNDNTRKYVVLIKSTEDAQ
jgi:hypothetical protein